MVASIAVLSDCRQAQEAATHSNESAHAHETFSVHNEDRVMQPDFQAKNETTSST